MSLGLTLVIYVCYCIYYTHDPYDIFESSARYIARTLCYPFLCLRIHADLRP